MVYKLKVCNDFNTIEWETENPNLEEMQKMLDIVSQLSVVKTEEKVAEVAKPASEAQKLLMRQKSIEYDENITSKEAYVLLMKAKNVYPNKNIK